MDRKSDRPEESSVVQDHEYDQRIRKDKKSSRGKKGKERQRHRQHHEDRASSRKKHRRHREDKEDHNNSNNDYDDGRKGRDYSSDEYDRKKSNKRKKDKQSRHDSKSSDDRRKRSSGRGDEDRTTEERRSKRRRHESTSALQHNNSETRAVKSTTTRLKVDKAKLVFLGKPLGRPPTTLLDPERDYFAYHKHLWLYLYRDCSIAFNDLSSKEARRAFTDFVDKYNGGQLEEGYYAPTLSVEALDECKTTRFSWGFKTSDQEVKNLHVLQVGVHKQTEYQAGGGGATRVSNADSAPVVVPQRDNFDHHDNSQSGIRRPEEKQSERMANRRLREHVKTVHDEITGGRKEGHERQIEKRKELSAKIHGAARGQQEIELNDDVLYGGDDKQSFQQALAASKRRSAAREAEKQARANELKQKELDRQNAMLESLGLSHKIGQRIQIQPRDGPS